jgi:hypothetical protein
MQRILNVMQILVTKKEVAEYFTFLVGYVTVVKPEM